MKTIIINIIILILYSASTSSQVYSQYNFKDYGNINVNKKITEPKSKTDFILNKYSIYSGISFNRISAGDNITNVIQGFSLGFQIDNFIDKSESIQAGIKYTQKGGYSDNGIEKVTANINYFEVPATYNYFFDLGSVQPFIRAGAYFSFYLTSSQDQEYYTGQVFTLDNDFTKELYKGSDYGLLGGGGVNFNVSNNIDMFVQINYSYGLRDFSKYSDIITLYNRNIEITAGFKWF